jgi:DNA ligase-1
MNRFNLLDSIIASKDTVEEAGRRLIDQYKYEGAVVWNPFGYYKHGRATYKEQLAFKFVDWARDEALVVDFQELQGNCDTSTTKLDNMMPMNMLGALVVESAKYGRFNIGTGFSNAQRIEIWNSREVYRNKLITFKYKPGHIKYVPCPAVFVGFRNPLDLSLS